MTEYTQWTDDSFSWTDAQEETISVTLPGLQVFMSDDSVGSDNSISAELPMFSIALEGNPEGIGIIEAELPVFEVDMEAQTNGRGEIESVLPMFEVNLSGNVAKTVSIAAELPQFVVSLEGNTTITGAVTATLPALMAELAGEPAKGGRISVRLGVFDTSLTGYSSSPTATITAELPMLEQDIDSRPLIAYPYGSDFEALVHNRN